MNAGSIRSQVLIFPGALGDFLLALPTLRTLRQRHPGRTTLVVPEPLRSLARLAGAADDVASLDDASSAWLFGGRTLPRWLAGRPVVRSWLGHAGGIGDRLGTVAGAVTLHGVERGAGMRHAAAAYATAADLRIGPRALWRRGRLELAESPTARPLVASLVRPILAVHRGAGAPAKRWGLEAFRAVASRWRGAGGSVIDVSGPAEANDLPLGDAVAVRGWPLADVGSLLAMADAYLGNDSGVSHLAAALGTRTVVVFTATSLRRWRPLGLRVVALRSLRNAGASHPSVDRVLQALGSVESLTSTHPGSSVAKSRHSTRLRRSASTSAESGSSLSHLDAGDRLGTGDRSRRRR